MLTRQNKPPQTTNSLPIPYRLTGNRVIHLVSSKRIPRDIQIPHADPVANRIGLVQDVLENERVCCLRVIGAAADLELDSAHADDFQAADFDWGALYGFVGGEGGAVSGVVVGAADHHPVVAAEDTGGGFVGGGHVGLWWFGLVWSWFLLACSFHVVSSARDKHTGINGIG